MSRIHEDSPTAVLAQYGLWEVPGTQDMVLEDRVHVIRPITTYTSSTPIRFEIRPPIDEYCLLNESDLYIRLKVTLSNKDGTPITSPGAQWQRVTPVRNLMHSLFKHVILCINGRQITLNPYNYAYRAFFEHFFAFTDVAKRGLLDLIAWSSGSGPESLLLNGATGTTSVLEMEGMLNLDLTFQEKAILGGCPMTLILTPNPPEFYMKVEDEKLQVAVEFEDVFFKCHRQLLIPAVVKAHEEALKQQMARYVFTRTEVKHRIIPANVNDYVIDNIFTGQLPRRLLIAFVSNNAYNGIGKEDPFEFKPFNISFLTSYIDGRSIPEGGFNTDFTRKQCVTAFRSVYKALNQTGTDTYYSNNRLEWMKNPVWAINYSVDLSNGGSMTSHMNLKKEGQLSVHVKFASKNTEPIVALFFSETDTCLEIDSLRQAHLEL